MTPPRCLKRLDVVRVSNGEVGEATQGLLLFLDPTSMDQESDKIPDLSGTNAYRMPARLVPDLSGTNA